MSSATPKSLEKFVDFCQQYITGKERKEAQVFLDRFFQAFGHEGVLEAGGSYEEAIKKRNKKDSFNQLQAQRFILQCMLAMFAQARGLLPQDLFLSCVKDCLNGASSYDILGGLFREMNQPGITPAGQYQGVNYFNGGLFSQIQPIELNRPELEFLEAASLQDWNKIRPAIFGNIFEGTANEDERHAYGIHYTSEA